MPETAKNLKRRIALVIIIHYLCSISSDSANKPTGKYWISCNFLRLFCQFHIEIRKSLLFISVNAARIVNFSICDGETVSQTYILCL